MSTAPAQDDAFTRLDAVLWLHRSTAPPSPYSPSTYNARSSSGTLPATTFLTTGSTTIGATMD